MSSDIIQLGVGDFDEAMAFLDLVFSKHEAHDFARMLPSIYQPTDEYMRYNYAVREGGRIGAIVGVFPIKWRVGDVTLRVAGVGGVSVHPESRGKGYMKLLMNHAVAEMRREGYDLSYLGGRRQRYAYFGYEVAGTTCRMNFCPDNIRHTFRGQDSGVTFEPVAEDDKAILELKTLHDAQLAYCERSAETFHRFLRSWHCRPSLARDADGRVIGYAVAQREDPMMNEFVARDARAAARMVHAWIGQTADKVSLLMYPPAGRVLHHLNGFAETMCVEPGGNWQVFEWVKVIDALMKVQHAAGPLAYGAVVIGIGKAGVTLAMSVDADGARCEAADREPDLRLDELTAIRVLFGPGTPSTIMQLPASASMLSAWCPLPLGISHQDHV